MTRKPAVMSITMRDVARQAGVSVATVSRYLNDTAPVSPNVGERIAEVMTRLRYRPHSVARQLATSRTMAIGLLLGNTYNDFFGSLIYGIEEIVQRCGYNLLVATNRPEHKHIPYPALGDNNVDGLLVFADSLNELELRILHEHRLPMVLIHRSAPNSLRIPSVTVENKAATFKIIEHLVTVHGRRQIVFMRGKEQQEDSHWREVGYREALAAHSIKFDPKLMLPGDYERQVAYMSMREFLAQPEPLPFDAVFTGDDSAAIGILEALSQSKLRVPRDVSVVGFNDLPHSSFLNPPLTTVRAPTDDIGRIAATAIFDILNNQPVDDITLLPTEMIVRKSCGCGG